MAGTFKKNGQEINGYQTFKLPRKVSSERETFFAACPYLI
jgi:hypothetical protein